MGKSSEERALKLKVKSSVFKEIFREISEAKPQLDVPSSVMSNFPVFFKEEQRLSISSSVIFVGKNKSK